MGGVGDFLMRVAIVCTGDELMQGVIVNTNAAWLAEQCHKLGSEVVWQVTVSDDEGPIGEAVQEATSKAACVLVSGGLGPTTDDITIASVEKVFGKMKGTSLANKVGTAPGVQVTLGKAVVFFLPGVPPELYQIFSDSILPWLRERQEGAHAERVLHCFGMREAVIDEKLRNVDLCGTRLSFRVKFPEVLLKVLGQKAEKAAANIRQCLGDVVYGEGDAQFSQVVGDLLRAKRTTIAVAESCTGGQIADLITDISGSSDYFERGLVTYSNRSKMELLGVAEVTIQKHGAVSRECAVEMARGVRVRSGTTLGLAVTGIAGPTGDTAEKPVGTVHLALAWDGGEQVEHFCFTRERKAFKQLVSWTALNMVREHFL
ncbi:MAG: nicotinamide-nucleotide amidohydrolase family protein [Deltaproteobacteria bacterium]|nr:nicotinamide-nucleotide amidohydrolase family protein [Deltaproteobacteria bacterium]